MIKLFGDGWDAIWHPTNGEIDIHADHASIGDLHNLISRLANEHVIRKVINPTRKTVLPEAVCTS